MSYFYPKNFRSLILFIIWLPISLLAHSQSYTSPIKVEYGIFIKKIVPDFKEGKFYSEFYWWIKFTNDSSQTGWTNDDIANIEYVNACDSKIGSFSEEVQEKKILALTDIITLDFIREIFSLTQTTARIHLMCKF